MPTTITDTYEVTAGLPGSEDWAMKFACFLRDMGRAMAQTGNTGVRVHPVAEASEPDEDGTVELVLTWESVPAESAGHAISRVMPILDQLELTDRPAFRLCAVDRGLAD